MKRYTGSRTEHGVTVTVDGVRLNSRLDLRNHSPTGFEWGYGGSGPAQLALAILADHLAIDAKALADYQNFKWHVVANLPLEGWTLSSAEIEEVLRRLAETGGDGDGR